MTSDPWQQPAWHVTVPPGAFVAAEREPAVRWPGDAVTFAATTVFAALLGPVVGLLWSAIAPKLPLQAALDGSETAFRNQVGADAWFLLLGLAAGVLCAGVALALRGRGPATTAGLAVGGALGAVIADRVGYLAQRAATTDAVHAAGLRLADVNLGLIDFRVRALGVLVAWPLAAVAVHALALALRRRTP